MLVDISKTLHWLMDKRNESLTLIELPPILGAGTNMFILKTTCKPNGIHFYKGITQFVLFKQFSLLSVCLLVTVFTFSQKKMRESPGMILLNKYQALSLNKLLMEAMRVLDFNYISKLLSRWLIRNFAKCKPVQSLT